SRRPARCPRPVRARVCVQAPSWPSALGGIVALDELAQHVVGARLGLLDARDVLRARDDDVVGKRVGGDHATVVADEGDRGKAAPAVEETAISVSPARPWAITWREKIAATPMSFAIAVRIDGSSVRSIAARETQPVPVGGERKSATTSIAPVAE